MPFLSLDLNTKSTEMGPWTGPTPVISMRCTVADAYSLFFVASFPLDLAFPEPNLF